MCKQALWLAPAPPASTPNHYNYKAINYPKQKSSSYDGYKLLYIYDTVLKSWFKSVIS